MSMTKAEWAEVYLKCVWCARNILASREPGPPRLRACKDCWRLRRVYAPDMSKAVICGPIMWKEWEANG